MIRSCINLLIETVGLIKISEIHMNVYFLLLLAIPFSDLSPANVKE